MDVQGYLLRNGIWQPAEAKSFEYSDGDEVENRIRSIIERADDRSLFSAELRAAINDWPSRYYLSPIRANLLRPLNLASLDSILEVGAGCGALTRFLGESGAQVVALEGSARRAEIARLRCAELENVNVVCDDLMAFEDASAYSAVTLVGVLEYARRMLKDPNGERSMLRKVLSLLADDGVLILAIENKLGLKYLAGAPEDHTGIPFFGVNDAYTTQSVVTFGLSELRSMLSECGLGATMTMLPLPDYKLPTTVLASERIDLLPDAAAFFAQSNFADPQRAAHPSFSLERAWSSVCANGLAADMSNSFLIIAGRRPEDIARVVDGDCLAWHYSASRHASFAKQSLFRNKDGRVWIERSRLAETKPPSVPLRNSVMSGWYEPGTNLWNGLLDIMNRQGWSARSIAAWARPWTDLVARSSGVRGLDRTTAVETIDGALVDATPFNTLATANDLILIDQEWTLETPVEFAYLVYRGLRESLIRITSMAQPAGSAPESMNHLLVEVIGELGVSLSRADIGRYADLDRNLSRWVKGDEGVSQPPTQAELDAAWTRPLPIRLPNQFRAQSKVEAEFRRRLEQLRIQMDSRVAAANLRISELETELRNERAHRRAS